jgi:DnaJ-class molecular chaperone
MTEQEIAQTLKDSGLFDELLHNLPCERCEGRGTVWVENPDEEMECGHCGGDGEDSQKTDLLTADQAESILAEMGLQVISAGNAQFILVKDFEGERLWVDEDWDWLPIFKEDGLTLTERLNAALAYCYKDKKLKLELEQAIKEAT